MMVNDIRATLNIPPRVLVVEKEGGGTEIHYHLPSAVYALSDNPDLKSATESLDKKLEALFTKVLSEDFAATSSL